jgi:hypothetical protein
MDPVRIELGITVMDDIFRLAFQNRDLMTGKLFEQAVERPTRGSSSGAEKALG